MPRSVDRVTLAAFLIAVVMLGANWVGVRFSNRELPPFFGAAFRFAIASLILFAVVGLRGIAFPRGRALIGAVVVAMAGFALEGGEYGSRDLYALRTKVRREHEEISRLRHEVDSLVRLEHALKTDSMTQERAAREVYGMIRDGEKLYQVVPADSSRP